jgi:transcriptional regulator with XRE-family HTH domain
VVCETASKGMPRRELVRQTGISFSHVSEFESSVISPPREETISALAKILGVNHADTDGLSGLANEMPSGHLTVRGENPPSVQAYIHLSVQRRVAVFSV